MIRKYKDYLSILEHNSSKYLYHGSPYNFDKFNNRDIFLTDNEKFAYEYSRQKSADFSLDNDTYVYTITLDSDIKIFNINEDNNVDKISSLLDDTVKVATNNFGFKYDLDKQYVLDMLQGFEIVKPYENMTNVKVGDIVYVQDGGDYLYYIVSVNHAEKNCEGYSICYTSSGYTFKFLPNFELDMDNDNGDYNNLEKISKIPMFNLVYTAIYDKTHRIHNELLLAIQNYVAERQNKDNFITRTFVTAEKKVKLEENWRYYENNDVQNAIKKLGYDGYVAFEKNIKTYCIFADAVNKINIVSKK